MPWLNHFPDTLDDFRQSAVTCPRIDKSALRNGKLDVTHHPRSGVKLELAVNK